ncbi:MAG: glucosaminidase domain-containing protein [Acidobacteriaceae bacterium]
MTPEENEFLKTAVPAAQFSQRMYGVPASITIAQAILESGWGKSGLTRLGNNYFGIKAVHAAALRSPEDYIEFPTVEYEQGVRVTIHADFAKYGTVSQCFVSHARLLAMADRYKPAMAVRSDAAKFAEQLQACGYSTNPNYAGSLMQLVKEFDLTQYDAPPEPAAQQAVA